MIRLDGSKRVKSKKSWKNLDTHYLSVIEDPWYKILMELQHQISIATMNFYEKKNIKTLHLPVTTGSISSPMGLGSDSVPVQVNICGVETYLADSMQFMLEYGCRLNQEGTYYLMPSFRGEDADQRHLCQFYHSEAEITGTLEDVILLVEDYIKYLCKHILANCSEQILKVTNDLSHLEKLANYSGGFPRITLDKAIELLDKENDGEKTYEVHPLNFRKLNSKGEQKLIEMHGGIVWVTHFDHLSVPFYQAFDDEEKQKARCADLLFGIGEVVGAGERHQNGNELLSALKLHGVKSHEYEWYYNMKDKYPLKTSGFGMGVERFILWLLQHDDIRDCQIVPRFNGVNIIP